MAQMLVDEHGGEVPADMDALTALPGVGRKTANVVLGHALGVPGLPVDRHVLRVVNRIGIAEGDDPVEVEAQLCARAAAGDVDARLRRADPARPAHLPARSRSATAARCRDDCDYYAASIDARRRPSARPKPGRRRQAKEPDDDPRRVRAPRR